jgi:pimeloyl-ACP methyl ester carboxylesterase
MRFSGGKLDVPRGARALVIIIGGSSTFFSWLAEVLCADGYAVCRSDSENLDDVRAVMRHCQKHVALPTFLFGHAQGGDIAILAAEHALNLRGVITWSAAARMNGYDILRAVSRLSVPLLVVHGELDESVPVAASAQIAAAAPDASRIVISTATHSYNSADPLVHVPRELMLAADVTARFISAYS